MTLAQKQVLIDILEGTELHHGDCIGADAEAHDIAYVCGLTTVAHPPENPAKRAFKRANFINTELPYLDRNKRIVNRTCELIATPGEFKEQVRSGTWSTIRYARKLGRKITIIFPDGAVKRVVNVPIGNIRLTAA